MARKKSLNDGPILRSAILEAGARLYSERGFSATSIRDLADAVDISSSTLYHHFANKQEILYEILLGFMQNFVAEISPMLRDVQREPTERILRAIDMHLRISERDKLQLIIGSSVKRVLSPEQNAQVTRLQRDYRGAFLQAIRDGLDQGHFASSAPELTTTAILDMLNGVREWLTSEGALTIDEIVEHYQQLALMMLNVSRVSDSVPAHQNGNESLTRSI